MFDSTRVLLLVLGGSLGTLSRFWVSELMQRWLGPETSIGTVTVNMAGLPGISVPAGLDSKGLPLGLQLIGKPFAEEELFQASHVIEEAAGKFTAEKWW